MTSSTEEWRGLPGYEDAYQVSNLGRIRSRNHVLQPTTNWDGYLRVSIGKDGARRLVALHRLVALAFLPNPDNKPQVNHKNGNRADCRVTNLEWCTNAENQRHRNSAIGGGKNRKKRAVVNTTTGQIYESISEAARQTETCIASIQECCKGQRKTANGYGWQYKE